MSIEEVLRKSVNSISVLDENFQKAVLELDITEQQKKILFQLHNNA